MSFIDYAQFNTTLRRGYELSINGSVKSKKHLSDMVISGRVTDSRGETYDVDVDIAHPLASHCNCPVASAKKYLCEHEIALYFSHDKYQAACFAENGFCF